VIGERSVAAAHEALSKTADLRRAVNSARVRLEEQRRRAELLRAELAALRELARRAPAPDAMEAVRDSARVLATSLGSGARRAARTMLPYAALAAFAAAYDGRVPAPPAPAIAALAEAPATRPPLPPLSAAPRAAREIEQGEQEALLLADQWRSPSDGRTLAERAGAAPEPPGAPSRWSVDRTGERTYRVSLRADGGVEYELDVDLASGAAVPTPETAALLAPALVSRL
jgi:hypothetical protein